MRRLLVLFVPLFAACAPAGQTGMDGSAPAAQTAEAAPAGSIVGDYTVTLAESDFAATAPQEMRSRAAGSWMLAFHEGNHFVLSFNGRQVADGPYQVSGNRVTFPTGDRGPYACNSPATYTWQTRSGRTTFTPVGTDPCAGRALTISSRPFTRAP